MASGRAYHLGPRRDHSNPVGTYQKPGDGPPIKKRPKPPEPLPVRFNLCPVCNNSNVAIERVEVCRMCGSEIPPARHWATGNQAAWKKRR